MEAITELASTLRRAADLLDAIAREATLRKPEGPELPPLYSYPEAAEYLRVSKRRVERLAANGWFPKITIGRRVLFAREDLDAYIERLRREQ